MDPIDGIMRYLRRVFRVGMNSRVHPKHKTKYYVKNWATYDCALAAHVEALAGGFEVFGRDRRT